MKNIFAFIITILISVNVHAGTNLYFPDGLTDQQKAFLIAEGAQAAANNLRTAPPPPAPQESKVKPVLTDIEEISKALGAGLAETAKQLGIAANDFAKTPVGKLTTLLIVWHFIGTQLIHTIFGFLWLAATIPTWIWMYRRQFFTKTTTYYDKNSVDAPKGVNKTVVVELSKVKYEAAPVVYWITLMICLLIGFLAIITA